MKTYFLIDGTNNNKVIGEFDSDTAAMDHVDSQKNTENWENAWDSFEDYKGNFYTVDSDQMKEAVRTYGNKRKHYWT